ncbi:VOC family protein [Cellulomonas sp. NPDC089187]|uniref:VOC family protein n=1 Tax=Cellulomonas sp. NPDC089187 TaxID=3154970 RepID=UPI003446A7AA
MAGFHHVELWVESIGPDWEWLLDRVGFVRQESWPGGQSWAAGGAYLTLTVSPTMNDPVHDRRRAGLNHLAFALGSSDEVDAVMAEAPEHGWLPLYQERYPHAGGPRHYAGWLANAAGFKIELVAV